MRSVWVYGMVGVWDAARRTCAVLVMLTVGALPLTGCFSERGTTDVDPAAVCSLPITALKQGGAFVPIQGFAFLVDTLRVKAGTRVTWVNCEAAGTDPHTSTSDTGVWNSPLIPIGTTYSRVFSDKGTFSYHCTPHSTMRGVIIVE